jgi:hypothetical protein
MVVVQKVASTPNRRSRYARSIVQVLHRKKNQNSVPERKAKIKVHLPASEVLAAPLVFGHVLLQTHEDARDAAVPVEALPPVRHLPHAAPGPHFFLRNDLRDFCFDSEKGGVVTSRR